jgi:hypothetical protein
MRTGWSGEAVCREGEIKGVRWEGKGKECRVWGLEKGGDGGSGHGRELHINVRKQQCRRRL